VAEQGIKIGAVTVDPRHIQGAWFLVREPDTLKVRLWTGERYYTDDPGEIAAVFQALGRPRPPRP
jgi:hypothetical protein